MGLMKKTIRWNPEKAAQLRSDPSRGEIGFEDCVVALENGGLLDTIENPSGNHPEQFIYVLNIGGYVYSVPFVETKDEIFLKTLFPNRKLTALYLKRDTP